MSRLDPDGREIVLGCEEFTRSGPCKNRAIWGGYLKGGGRVVPVCGVHARHWSTIAEDMLVLDEMSLDGLLELRRVNRERLART